MATYNNGIHFLEAAIGTHYKIRREGILKNLGEAHERAAKSMDLDMRRDKYIKGLETDLVTLANSCQQAKTIFKLIETARLPLEHEDDFAKRIIDWLETNLPEGGFLKRGL